TAAARMTAAPAPGLHASPAAAPSTRLPPVAPPRFVATNPPPSALRTDSATRSPAQTRRGLGKLPASPVTNALPVRRSCDGSRLAPPPIPGSRSTPPFLLPDSAAPHTQLLSRSAQAPAAPADPLSHLPLAVAPPAARSPTA